MKMRICNWPWPTASLRWRPPGSTKQVCSEIEVTYTSVCRRWLGLGARGAQASFPPSHTQCTFPASWYDIVGCTIMKDSGDPCSLHWNKTFHLDALGWAIALAGFYRGWTQGKCIYGCRTVWLSVINISIKRACRI
uniref:Uncharacterized protein n=1 Tax=Pyxicephalus adspersus TaxID=30357 RepID=A0AAV2ZN09_PYXAD|nr:TPA: hypothetical protein GDO54_015467 [Pyxicephalus adspersus]